MQRASGLLRLDVVRRNGRSRLSDLRQQGCLKLFFPRTGPGEPFEAVLVNSSGGIVGGDALEIAVRADRGTHTILATQATERCYRARRPGETASVSMSLDLAGDAVVEWLPMETILFDGCSLDRRLTAELAAEATLLAVESRIFGRTAHGERLRSIDLCDRLTVRRDGRPVLIDTLRLNAEGEEALSHAATAGGGIAAATIVLASPDAERRLGDVRARLEGDAGASAWNGILVVRLVSRDAQAHRRQIVDVLGSLRGGRSLPAVWRC